MSLFITFEGIEGAGKTSRLQALAEHLRNRNVPVTVTHEPGGCPLADGIRALLLAPDQPPMADRAELLLYLAARAQHVREVVRPALERGDVVLCDRFHDSTLAYQGYARGLDIPLIRQINQFAAGITPDATFLLDLPAEEGLRRSHRRDQLKGQSSDRLEREHLDFHRKVRDGFLKLASGERERFHIFDATRPPKELDREIAQRFAVLASSSMAPGR